MKGRRSFLKKSALMAAGLVIGKNTNVFASLAGFSPGIIYTKKNPGKWSKKAESHAPKVNVEGKKITITTKHPMSKKHYIVRHTLVSPDGKVLGAKTFYPSDKKAISTYGLPSNHWPKLYVTSFCNLHDLWVTEFGI